ncbi:MAG: hypothetical protein V3R54_06340 [Thermodesulfovibrionia bacterium]
MLSVISQTVNPVREFSLTVDALTVALNNRQPHKVITTDFVGAFL